jgi:hypothetical protein
MVMLRGVYIDPYLYMFTMLKQKIPPAYRWFLSIKNANFVGPVGIEPTTCGLKGSVSLRFGIPVSSSKPQANFR